MSDAATDPADEVHAGSLPSAGGVSSVGKKTSDVSVVNQISAASLVISHKSDAEFPMYVVPMATVLRMSRMEAFEALDDSCELVEFTQSLAGEVIFVSHTWLGQEHPDPDGVQLRALQMLCRNVKRPDNPPIRVFWQQELLFGAAQLPFQDMAKAAYVWLDYCSIPQAATARDLRCRAIACIAKYVFNSRFFVVLAPSALHRDEGVLYDYRTWGERGWCRVELFAHAIARRSKIIVVEGEANVYLDMSGSRDALLKPPGLGSFSVPEDKELLAPLLSRLVEARIQAEERGSMVRRLFQACRVQVLQGMGVTETTLGLEEWMESFGFRRATDCKASGWTPFRFAVYARRYDLAQQLLDAKADVEAPLAQEVEGYGFHLKGCTVLNGLSFIRDDPEGIAWLVGARASICRTCDRKLFSLNLAAVVGNLENVKMLLALKADPGQRNEFGDDSATAAVFGGQAQVARLLIKEHQGNFEETTVFGWRSSFAAVVCAGDPETLRMVLEHRADPNFQNSPWGFGVPMTKTMQAAFYFQHRKPTKVVELFSQVPGMTPLCGACFFGNLAQVRLLLQARADASLVNSYGRTPLSFAAAKGQQQLLEEVWQAAPHCLDEPDCWGLYPVDHALSARNGAAAMWLSQRGARHKKPKQLRPTCCTGRSEFVAEEAIIAQTKPAFEPMHE